eukprot:5172328-Pleurochrysis_carterae.AAC.1
MRGRVASACLRAAEQEQRRWRSRVRGQHAPARSVPAARIDERRAVAEHRRNRKLGLKGHEVDHRSTAGRVATKEEKR